MRYECQEPYIFVIDTEEYAGNFERPMCAFCTGQVGECGVGDEEAAQFMEDLKEFPELIEKFKRKITSIPDDNGCRRPASIYSTPGWFNDGLGGHYKESEKGSQKVRDAYKKKEHAREEEPGDFPAYMSVAIFFREEPDSEMIELMMERAIKFRHGWEEKKPVSITGFRLIKERISSELIGLWSGTPRGIS